MIQLSPAGTVILGLHGRNKGMNRNYPKIVIGVEDRMTTTNFDKAEFKKSVIYNVKSLYRKNIGEAKPEEVFEAVCYSVKDMIIDEWIATHKQYEILYNNNRRISYKYAECTA